MRLPSVYLLALAAACAAAPVATEAQSGDLPPAVSVEWLAASLAQPGLIVLQLGDDSSFTAAHIPGARRLDYQGVLSAPMTEGGLRLELPSPERLQADLRALGLRNDSRVVIVFDDARRFHMAGRAFFTLEWAGLRGRVAVLDGGLPAWQAANQPLRSGAPATATGPDASGRRPAATAPGDIEVRPVQGLVATRDSVLAAAQGRGRRLVDARTPEFYGDTRANGMPRGGHIASAVNLPFNSVVDERGLLKPRAELERLLGVAGLGADEALTTYCHIGLQASWAYFALRTLGRDVTLYDGSFDEWSRDAALPIEGQRASRP